MAFPTAFHSYLPRTHCVPTHTYGIVLVSDKGNILVVKGRLSEKWGFPKGHGNNGEKPLDAALRELKEEAGIDVSDLPPPYERRFKTKSGAMGGTYFIYKVKNEPSLSIGDTKEICDAMWCPKERLPSLLANMDLKAFCYRKYHLDFQFGSACI